MFARRRSYNDTNLYNCSVILGLITLAYSCSFSLRVVKYNLIYRRVSVTIECSPEVAWSLPILPRQLWFRRIRIQRSGRNQYRALERYFLRSRGISLRFR